VTVTGVVAQAVAERVATVARAVVVESGVEVAMIGGVLIGIVVGGVLVVVVGDETPAQPPATISTVRAMSAFVPFMATASVGIGR
jgi:hypothetical protein